MLDGAELTMTNWERATPSDEGQYPEVCVNLWWFRDVESGIVQRLAGRAYALTGSDTDKLRILHALSATDFHVAQSFAVPKNFKIITSFGEIEGAVDQSIIVAHQPAVFEHVYAALETAIPQQVRFIQGEPTTYRLELSQDVLNVVTCVFEYDDGRLVPQISTKHSSLQL
jgi:hypothetical protein